MTPELIELSKRAAEVLGVPAYLDSWRQLSDEEFSLKIKWLAEDSGRCADIAAERRISTDFDDDNSVKAYWGFYDSEQINIVEIHLADYNNDRLQAWRVAVIKAVIEKGKL